jgi:hypothetical protein
MQAHPARGPDGQHGEPTGRRHRLVGLGLILGLVAMLHLGVLSEVRDSLADFSRADRPPARIHVNFVRELAPTRPPVAVVAARAAPPPAAEAPQRVAAAEQPASAPRPDTAADKASRAASEAAAAAATGAASAPLAAASGAEMQRAQRMRQALADAAAARAAASQAAPTATSTAADSDAVLATVTALVNGPGAGASAIPAASAPGPSVGVPGALPRPGSAATPASGSSPADTFEWPPSTQLSYALTGRFRGPLYGSAQVQWLRDGTRYQVIMDVDVDPGLHRRSASEGTLGPDGLTPYRYDDETRIPLRDPRRSTVYFQGGVIKLANGELHERWPGTQDQASQFVQLAWLFAAHPDLLQVGRTIELPLALPRRVGRWVYDITEEVPVRLPFGEVPAFHLKPRAENRKPNEVAVDMWIAPSLQYLPIKLELRLDAETYLELVLKSKPLQADDGIAPGTPLPPPGVPVNPRF